MFRIGADPEVFLHNKDKYVSAIDKVGGTKDAPRQVDSLPPGFTVQEDNVAVEFGIPPCENEKSFVQAITKVQKAVAKEVKEKGLTFSKLSCVVFPEEEMNDPRAYIFGCEPDYNAWTGRVNRFKRPTSPFLRSAGGHVHVQLDEEHNPRTVIKYMDLLMAVPAQFMDNTEESRQRRSLYGKMGAYRPKPYGAEYRTLSNFWIFDKKYISWIWRTTKQAVDMSVADDLQIDGLHNAIADSINNNNLKRAEQLVKTYGLEVL